MSSNQPEDPQDEGFTDDLLREVRADWDAMGIGGALPSAKLDDQDAETRSAVSWMQSAWAASQAQDVPPMPIALAIAYRRPPARNRRPLRIARGLAALTLAIAGASIWTGGAGALFEGTHDGTRDRGPDGRVVADTKAEGHGTPTSVTPTDLEKPRAAAPAPTFTPDQFVSRSNGVEIVTGKVRIVLLETSR